MLGRSGENDPFLLHRFLLFQLLLCSMCLYDAPFPGQVDLTKVNFSELIKVNLTKLRKFFKSAKFLSWMNISMFVEQNKRHHRPAVFGNRNQLKVENQNLSEPHDHSNCSSF